MVIDPVSRDHQTLKGRPPLGSITRSSGVKPGTGGQNCRSFRYSTIRGIVVEIIYLILFTILTSVGQKTSVIYL